MRISAFPGSVVVALAGVMVVSACTVVVDEPGPGPGFCTREYRPVCARRYGEQRTFPNACEADRAGYRIVHSGQCRAPDRGEQRACTMEYRPVCARRDGRLRTFGNSCQADAAGWRVVSRGEC